MSTLERAMLDAMTQLLIDEGVKDVVRATSYEEEHIETGYCDTCYDSWTEVRITYDKIYGGTGVHTYYGYLSELIAALT